MPKRSDNPAGRPSKLTPELITKAEKLLRAGNYTSTVAALLGVDESTFYDWRKRGRKDLDDGVQSLHAQFYGKVQAAEAKAEEGTLKVILNAARGGLKVKKTTVKRQELVRRTIDPDWGPGADAYPEDVQADDTLLKEETTTTTEETLPNVQAAMWFLERKYPDRWGRRRLEITGKDGGPVRTQEGYSKEQLARLTDEELAQLDLLVSALEVPEDGAEEV